VHQMKRAMRSEGKQPSQNRDYDASRLLTAEIVRREDRDQYGDQDSRQPVFQADAQDLSLGTLACFLILAGYAGNEIKKCAFGLRGNELQRQLISSSQAR
jgi:hypothetical protein